MTGSPPLACTVRGCGQPLVRTAQTWRCDGRHSFDVARSGYVSLLQPQDRRSTSAGDRAQAVEARIRLNAGGVGSYLLEQLVRETLSLGVPDGATVVELGCGTGEFIGRLLASRPVVAVGIDLSKPAITHAARMHPAATWVVANADRRLPVLDASVDLVVSIHARRNATECARILKPGGWLLVVVPAHDDLAELREAVLGQASSTDRATAVVEEHAAAFQEVRRFECRERTPLSTAQLDDLLTGTYRGARLSVQAARQTLAAMTLTLASEALLFTHRGEPVPLQR